MSKQDILQIPPSLVFQW